MEVPDDGVEEVAADAPGVTLPHDGGTRTGDVAKKSSAGLGRRWVLEIVCVLGLVGVLGLLGALLPCFFRLS